MAKKPYEDVFSRVSKGVVPAPGGTGSTRYLNENGTFAVPAGGGGSGGGLTTEDVQDVVGALVQDSATIDATYNDAGNVEFLAVKTNSVQQKVGIQKGGTAIGIRQTINLIEGSGVSIGAVDNSGQDRVDVTLTATGGGRRKRPDDRGR